MSLQVWLPLTKDLRQQGLSDVTVTNNGATFNSVGKLGGCYQFNGSAYLYGDSISVNMKSASLWIKLDNTNNQVIFADYKSKLGFGIYSTYLVCSCADNTIRTTYPKTLLETNVWTHIVIIRRESVIDLYINGILQTPGTSKDSWTSNMSDLFTIGARSNGSTCMTGYINDFRMYDHCLSPMEVKQISQGLVLHYPLNRNGWGQENLARNTGVRAPDSTSQVEFRAFKVGNLPIVAGETITVSFDLKMEIGTAITNGTPYLYVYNTNYRGPHGKWIAFTNKVATPFIPIGNYAVGDIFEKRVFFTTTVASSFDPGTSTEDWIEFYSNYDTENKITINNLKIERGTIATPWCPHIEDTNNMGLNSTTEYDCSGFCNNGTRTGTFDWTSNTAKYAVSTKFNGTDNAIQTPSLPTMITDKNYTIAVWIYKTVIGSKGYQTIYGGPSGFEIEARNGSANETKFVPWNWGKPMASYELNEWNHCVFVHSDADCKIYLNGEYIATGTAKASNPTGNYFVGAWNTATQQNFDGLMSDFRIYATALSADDVKSLYQNCATIDPDGTIRGQIRS